MALLLRRHDPAAGGAHRAERVPGASLPAAGLGGVPGAGGRRDRRPSWGWSAWPPSATDRSSVRRAPGTCGSSAPRGCSSAPGCSRSRPGAWMPCRARAPLILGVGAVTVVPVLHGRQRGVRVRRRRPRPVGARDGGIRRRLDPAGHRRTSTRSASARHASRPWRTFDPVSALQRLSAHPSTA